MQARIVLEDNEPASYGFVLYPAARNNRRPRQILAPELGNELREPLDGAASAHARVDRVATRANALVLRLKVEAAVEVERRAVLVELGADPPLAAEA